jgi:MFS family permease
MAKGLHLIGDRYSLIVLIFFIPYVVFQPPATVVLRKVGPRRFLSGITLLWGSCMIGFGFVKKWDQMLGLRVILGILEAGFFPGCAYLLSTWYTRFELQKRNAVFYLIGSMASAISGILAYGIMQMDGIAGLGGWRWIFIVRLLALLHTTTN